MNENPIWKYLSDNNLTTLDESTWISEYSSNIEKQTKLYNYLKSNNLTTLDQTSFASKYLGKQEGAQPVVATAAPKVPGYTWDTGEQKITQPTTAEYYEAPLTISRKEHEKRQRIENTDIAKFVKLDEPEIDETSIPNEYRETYKLDLPVSDGKVNDVQLDITYDEYGGIERDKRQRMNLPTDVPFTSKPASLEQTNMLINEIKNNIQEAYLIPQNFGLGGEYQSIDVWDTIEQDVESYDRFKENIYQMTRFNTNIPLSKDSFISLFSKLEQEQKQIAKQKKKLDNSINNLVDKEGFDVYLNSVEDELKKGLSNEDRFVLNLGEAQSQLLKAREEAETQQEKDAITTKLNNLNNKVKSVKKSTTLFDAEGYFAGVNNKDLVKQRSEDISNARQEAISISSIETNPLLTTEKLYKNEIAKKREIESRGANTFVKIRYQYPTTQYGIYGAERTEGMGTQDVVSARLNDAGYKPDEDGYINISLYELNKIGVNQLNFTGFFDELRDQVSEKDLASIKMYEEDLTETENNVLGYFDAFRLNNDPRNVDKNKIVQFGTTMIASAGSRWLDIPKEQTERELIGVLGTEESRAKRYLDFQNNYNSSKEVISGQVQALDFDDEQLKAIETTFGEEIVEGVADFVPMILEFAAVSTATGLVGDIPLIARTAATMKNSGAIGRLGVHFIKAATEEAKMQGIFDFEAGTGVGFYAGGQLFKGARIFKGAFDYLNKPFNTLVSAGPVAAVSSEIATATNIVYEDLMDNKDFAYEFNKNFGDLSEVGKRMLQNTIIFAATGVHHVVGSFKNTNRQIAKTIVELRNERDLLSEEIKNKKDDSSFDLVSAREKLNNLIEAEATLTMQLKFATESAKLDPNENPNYQEYIKEKIEEPLSKELQKLSEDYSGFEFQWFDSKENANFLENKGGAKGSKALFVPSEKKGIKDIIYLDKNGFKYKDIHEMTHAAQRAVFMKNPQAKYRFTQNTKKAFEKYNLGKILGESKDLTGKELFKRIGEKYEQEAKALKEQGKSSKAITDLETSEFFAYLGETMADPVVYYTHPDLAGSFASEVMLSLKETMQSIGLKSQLPKNASAKDVVQLFASIGRDVNQGISPIKSFGQLAKLDEINVEGLKLMTVAKKAQDRYFDEQTKASSKDLTSVDKTKLNTSVDKLKTEYEREKQEYDNLLEKFKDNPSVLERIKADGPRETRAFREALGEINELTKNNLFEKTDALYSVFGKEGAERIALNWTNEIERRLNSHPRFANYRNNLDFKNEVRNIAEDTTIGVGTRKSQSVAGLIKNYDGSSPLNAWINSNVNNMIMDVIKNNYPKLYGKEVSISEGLERKTSGLTEEAAETSFEEIDISAGAPTVKEQVIKKEDSGKVDPRDFVTEEKLKEYESLVDEKFVDIDLDNVTFSSLREITPSISAQLFGVSEKKIVDKKANLSPSEMANAQKTFYEIGFDNIGKILPYGTVPAVEGDAKKITKGETTDVIPEALIGTSTGVPTNILKTFYEKQDRVKTPAGLPEWLKKKIKPSDVAEALGMDVNGKVINGDPRSSTGQLIKGMMELTDRVISNKIVREKLLDKIVENKDYAYVINRIAAGKSQTMSSKDLSEYLSKTENKELLKDLLFSIGQIGNLSRKELLDKYINVSYIKNPDDLNVLKDAYNKTIRSTTEKTIDVDYVEKLIDPLMSFQKELQKVLSDQGIQGKGLELGILGVHFRNGFLNTKSYLKENGYTDLKGEPLTKVLGVEISNKAKAAKPGKKTGIKSTDSYKSLLQKIGELYEQQASAKDKQAIDLKIEKLENELRDPIYNQVKVKLYNEINKAKEDWYNSDTQGITKAQKAEAIAFMARATGNVGAGMRQLIPTTIFPEQYKANIKYRYEHTTAMMENSLLDAISILSGQYKEKKFDSIKEIMTALIPVEAQKEIDNIFGRTNTTVEKLGYLLNFEESYIYKPLDGSGDRKLFDLLADLAAEKLETDGLTLEEVKEFTQPAYKDILAEYLITGDANSFKISEEQKQNFKEAHESLSSKALKAGVLSSKELSNLQLLEKLKNRDEALRLAGKRKKQAKKIRVFDFDDTLVKSKNKVYYTSPDGKKGSLDAKEFGTKGSELADKGYTFDFSDFANITEPEVGPLFSVADIINKKRGSKDIFVLTARASNAKENIKKTLDAMGLEIPIENIVTLGNSSEYAKSNWILEKAAKGYNDFYFADDVSRNVKAVKEVLDQLDVKSRVQQAMASKDLSKDFNVILQRKSGIRFNKKVSGAEAKVAGDGKGKYDFWIPASAEDFKGLLYKTLPKGKQGEQALEFYNENLFRPFAKAEAELNTATVALNNDYRAIKKDLKVRPEYLNKKNPTGFTNEQSLRAWLFNAGGHDIPGMSEKNLKDVLRHVNGDQSLLALGKAIMKAMKTRDYTKPSEGWLGGNINNDMYNFLRKEKRDKALENWKENVKEIFSEDNLNKLQSMFGTEYRIQLEKTLKRMEEGRNRAFQSDIMNRFYDYINGSTAAVMFFNTKSAMLQTISSANFINWSFNNPIEAAKSFANQKQYWSDFNMLFNSDYLVSRRKGLKINIAEAELSDIQKTSKNKVEALFNALQRKGYIPTQYADSFAIASGGATFYRNLFNKLVKEGMKEKEAHEEAMSQWRELSEDNQQSSRTDKISEQQASAAGRIILTFANTPMQYARLTKRAAQDLINGRGSVKENVSKILYYQFIQNAIFSVLQQGLFATMFSDDVDDDKQFMQNIDLTNSMLNSTLRGLGIYGATAAMAKDVLLKVYKETKESRPDYGDAAWEILNIAPPLDSKISKIRRAGIAAEYGAYDNLFEDGFSLNSPAIEPSAQLFTAVTNIPLDRVISKLDNVQGAISGDMEMYERIALLGGYKDWQLGIKDEEFTPIKIDSKNKVNIDRSRRVNRKRRIIRRK